MNERLQRTFSDWRTARQQLPEETEVLEKICLDLRERFPARVRDLDPHAVDFGPLQAALKEHRARIDFEFPGLLPTKLSQRELISLVIFISSHFALKQLLQGQ